MSRPTRARGSQPSRAAAPKTPNELVDVLTGILSEAELGLGLKQIPTELYDHQSELSEGDLDVIRNTVALSSHSLVAFRECLEQWAASTDVNKERVWEIFGHEGIPHRGLSLWVHALNEAHDENSFHSACAYLALLRLPGNVNIFNPLVLRSSLSLMKLWARANQAVHSKAKPKGRSNNTEDDGESGDDQMDHDLFEDDDDTEAQQWLTQPKIQEQVLAMISAVSAVMNTLSLEKYPDALAHIGEALIDVTRTVPNTDMSKAAYNAMHALVVPLHGPTSDSFKLLLKNMLPSVLMTFMKTLPTTVPKPSLLVRQDTVDFIISIATSSSMLWLPILNFVEHLCVRAPDKAEYKRATTKSIVDLCLAFPNIIAKFSNFLCRLSRNVKISFRVVAVEVATEILHYPVLLNHSDFELPAARTEDLDASVVDEEEVRAEGEAPTQPHPRVLLKILLDRCSDKGATVRAKALTSLAASLELAVGDVVLSGHFSNLLQAWSESFGQLISPSNEGVQHWGSPARTSRTPAGTPATGASFMQPAFTPSSTPLRTPRDSTPASPSTTQQNTGLRKIASILCLRSADMRPLVRKAAIQALRAIFLVAGEPVWTTQDLQVFFDGCQDSSLAIRKASMSALSELLVRYPDDANLNKVWLGAVFPLTKDPELTAQDDALQQIDSLILQRVIAALKPTPNYTASIWATLDGLDGEMIQCLDAAIALMVRRKMFPMSLIKPLNKVIPSSTQKGVWILLESISARMPEEIEGENLIAAWNSCQPKKDAHHFLFKKILSCMGNIAQQLPKNECAALAVYLFNSLGDFKVACPPELAQTMIHTMHLTCLSLQTQGSLPAKDRIPIPPWEQELRKACETGIEAFIFQQNKSVDFPKNDAALIRRLFILGEVALRSNVDVPKMTITLVQAMTSPTVSPNLGGLPSPDQSQSLQPIVVSNEVRAHAYVALGKMCLKKEALAKKIMPLMVAELHDGKSAVIQNNILIVLCDLARTFTAVVDNYVPTITFCLRSTSELVRKHTLMILAQLLQEDYLKWKASMFFRFLTAIVDDSRSIRKLGEQCFRSIILLKAPNKFYMHFIETVFFLNNCTKHSVYNQFHVEQDASFAILSQRRRNVIYNFLLEFMSDVQKFQTAAKLCQDVLGSVVEGSILLEDSTVFDVVKDTLLILASKSIKIGKQHAGAEDGEEPEPAAEESEQKVDEQKNAAVVKGKFLSGLQKKNTLESVVPILIELKRLCERQQSPLLRYLMLYLKELMADYKHELEDVLAADRQLAAELQYDLRQFALQQKAAKQTTELRRLSLTPARADSIRRVSLTPGMHRSLSHPKITPSSAVPLSSVLTPMFSPPNKKRLTPASAPSIRLMSPGRPLGEKKWNVEKSVPTRTNQVPQKKQSKKHNLASSDEDEALVPKTSKKPKSSTSSEEDEPLANLSVQKGKRASTKKKTKSRTSSDEDEPLAPKSSQQAKAKSVEKFASKKKPKKTRT